MILSEGVFLVSLLGIQFILYFLLTFKIINWAVGKKTIFIIAVTLCIIAPWLYPVQGGLNEETGEYICGLASFLPVLIFWFIGNIVNVILILFFSGIDWFRNYK